MLRTLIQTQLEVVCQSDFFKVIIFLNMYQHHCTYIHNSQVHFLIILVGNFEKLGYWDLSSSGTCIHIYYYVQSQAKTKYGQWPSYCPQCQEVTIVWYVQQSHIEQQGVYMAQEHIKLRYCLLTIKPYKLYTYQQKFSKTQHASLKKIEIQLKFCCLHASYMYLACVRLVALRQRCDHINKINRKVANGSSSNILSHKPVAAYFIKEIECVPLL